MECYRIDESGYTGFDLFNASQRFQGASAVALSNEEAEYLIRQKRFRRGTQASAIIDYFDRHFGEQ